MMRSMQCSIVAVLAPAVIWLLVSGSSVRAQSGSSSHLAIQGGEALYKEICQACHMPDAKGALGAGAYPSLAANPKLTSKHYPVFVVVNGLKAMPPFGNLLSDRQIADVVNYTRSHFGNRYTDAVIPDEVRALRPKAPDVM